MIRIQTILSTERLWMPIHVHYNYGTVDDELPVSIEESLVFTEEPPSLVITEEHVEHLIEQEMIEPESVVLEEEVKDEPNETASEIKVESAMTSEIKIESVTSEIKAEPVTSEIKAESVTSEIKAESVTSEIEIESVTSEKEEQEWTVQEEQVEIIKEKRVFEKEEQLPLTITIDSNTAVSVSDKSSIENKSKEDKTVDLSLDMLISDDPVTSEEELSPINPSIISSSSSFSPITPTSVESPLENQLKSSPTRNSLFRRETNKLNHKRRSLTKKLKNVLVHSNKKISL
ncbi:hypothetical protein G6F46_010855 [Rhizopus delemar]|uniref:Uncharacterized protein n=3 Tax=Rhizopus TaxID=4842 RepID=I1BZP3_RHIO9|nr:hypothetical protein RO3G_06378 [Rhizopus delemar RA 99-880]KAG1455918.1 hypothetical protein G6F55_006797 [Rhizopus delemar]KAG1538411.1 hypothetical protein G6F51_009787 [Rhizopus arrhizus]KAG1492501.1 hypothetical protein G6F54_009268 [Rhizopus delemar]KAG1509935.1 hypothetical protein G6F53_007062 [Rhizopus delemar]|eukprot:EIE81673.1 hypothetical protein RO3G_06378 [Rhizopus delemar RA 99-880]